MKMQSLLVCLEMAIGADCPDCDDVAVCSSDGLVDSSNTVTLWMIAAPGHAACRILRLMTIMSLASGWAVQGHLLHLSFYLSSSWQAG